MNKTLYIMQGIPGSGKSTIAKTIADRVEGIIFSTDDFWYMNPANEVSYNFVPEKLGIAHQWNQQRCAKEMAAPDSGDIIIDNTNVTKSAAEPYIVLAKIWGYNVQVIRVQVPLDVAIKRQENRSEDRKIPEDVIQKMYGQMEDLV